MEQGATWRVKGQSFIRNPEQMLGDEKVPLPIPTLWSFQMVDRRVEGLADALAQRGHGGAVGMASCVGPLLRTLVRFSMVTAIWPLVAMLCVGLIPTLFADLTGAGSLVLWGVYVLWVSPLEAWCIRMMSISFLQDVGYWPVFAMAGHGSIINSFKAFFCYHMGSTVLAVFGSAGIWHFLATNMVRAFQMYPVIFAGMVVCILAYYVDFAETVLQNVPLTCSTQWRVGGFTPDHDGGHDNPLEEGVIENVHRRQEWPSKSGQFRGGVSVVGEDRPNGARFIFTSPLGHAGVTTRQACFAMCEFIGFSSGKSIRFHYRSGFLDYAYGEIQDAVDAANARAARAAVAGHDPNQPFLTRQIPMQPRLLRAVTGSLLAPRELRPGAVFDQEELKTMLVHLRSLIGTRQEFSSWFTFRAFFFGLLHKGMALLLQVVWLWCGEDANTKVGGRMFSIAFAAYNCFSLAVQIWNINQFMTSVRRIFAWYNSYNAQGHLNWQTSLESVADEREAQHLRKTKEQIDNDGMADQSVSHYCWMVTVLFLYIVMLVAATALLIHHTWTNWHNVEMV